MNQPALTVAICTYRRADILAQTLASLARCEPPATAWDLLVVDNAGEATVRDLAASYRERLPMRYVVETATGTSHARNRAVRECEQAGVAIVLFTDDDVTFDPAWLRRMAAAVESHPECDFWGGRVEPVWTGASAKPPQWFDPQICPMLGDTIVQYRRGESPRYWHADEDPPFYTANLALRVARVAEAGYFDVTVGHRGAIRMGMEDSLMIKALAQRGGHGWYAADAVVHHPVPPERLKRAYARQFAWRQGWLSVWLLRQENAQHVPRWLYRVALGGMCSGISRWLGGMFTARSAHAFAGQFQALFNLSKLWHALFGSAKRS